VNPLSQRLRELVEIPAAWPGGIYAETGAPLHIDVGSACGSFLLGLAQAQPEFNYVGLEIRRAMVDFANARAESIHAAGKVFFLCCNANAAMEKIFEQYTSGVVQRITINFPDPYFKRRQQKRRVVQPEFVRMLATKLATGAEIICQTDVSEVQGYVNEVFQSDGNFTREELSVSPFPVLTERELSSLRNGRQIYRSRFVRL
jgi:tRNA (guanine-N7-)-methyltransferase